MSWSFLCPDKFWRISIQVNFLDEIIFVMFCSQSKVVLFPVRQAVSPGCPHQQQSYLGIKRVSVSIILHYYKHMVQVMVYVFRIHKNY